MQIAAIIGRPNVGKSTLFNKLTGKRISIVDDTPGVTRDRIYSECEWRSRKFMLTDTGGIEPETDETIPAQMRRQAQIAVAVADVIIFLVNMREGCTPDDIAVGEMLRKTSKPIILAVNKCDSLGEPPMAFYEFYNLGLGEPIPVSASHGHGTGDLLDKIFEHFPHETPIEHEDEYIKVAVIGKPNTGKSSLINYVSGEERSIVSDIAGTTRDAIDSVIDNEHGKFIFIDTAGIRRKSKVTDKLEHFSVLRAYMAVERADVCVIMIDGAEGFTDQDSKVAGFAHEKGKGCIVAVNKWDIVEKTTNTMNEMRKSLADDFSFMNYVPFEFISAKTGRGIDGLFKQIINVNRENCMRISTGMLNDVLAYAVARVQPPTDKGRRLKIYYMTQPSTKPPTFVCFVNRADLFHFSYQRYIENQIRQTFGLTGTPVRLIVRERNREDD
ncbi:MAG: ribosome biogenesis GTPase Der [Ruminococcus sp.]|jgi:GTP-binding protein|nr:ribosome biogenesis GTPase Der [Ruminococcus sp.]